jgi:hypothetical protein
MSKILSTYARFAALAAVTGGVLGLVLSLIERERRRSQSRSSSMPQSRISAYESFGHSEESSVRGFPGTNEEPW